MLMILNALWDFRQVADMRALLYSPAGCMHEECCMGGIPTKILPAQVFLAGAYLKSKGKEVTVIDGQTQSTDFKGYDVVVVWVSLLDGLKHEVEFLQTAKQNGARTVMILNDPIQDMEREVMERYPFIDAAIRLHEREATLGELLDAWENGVERPEFKGVMHRAGDRIIDNGERPWLKNLEHLPSSAELLRKLPLDRYESAFIITGRGCPHQCTFCEYRGTGARKRKIGDVLAEFDVVNASKIERVFALDLNMPANRPWTDEFLKRMKEKCYRIKWQTDARAPDCSIELMTAFREAGCTNMVIGVESLDDTILEKIKKGTNVKMIMDAIDNCRKAGIAPSLSFMIGFPWDSNQTMENYVKILKAIAVPSIMTRFVRPHRGTPIYEECRQLGVLDRDLHLDDYISSRHYPIMPTLHMTKEEVYAWDAKIQRAARLTPAYLWNFYKERGFKLRYIQRFFELLFGKHIIQ